MGKLVQTDQGGCVVAYFCSPADDEPINRVVSRASLKRAVLPAQTRVYYRNPETLSYEVGRVLDFQAEDQSYLVRFPNDCRRMIAEGELSVRCRLPISDPTEHLAFQLNETAFWHQGRSELVRHIVHQRKASGGLSALISSSVELVPHQASVIRRVLLDPFQRYLLADEVGLGKTIEAGTLIKQFCRDEPDDHLVLVIVPEALRVQWTMELSTRFHLSERIGKTIHVVASRDKNRLQQIGCTARMIVVDEAHHLSSWAWSDDQGERELFETVQRVVEPIDRRVLLLSATPVLHNERSFLAMLHLLDPQVYRLEQFESFKKRVQLRQQIAECMLSLSESESNFFLEQTLEELSELLIDDAEFIKLKTELLGLVQADVAEEDERRVTLIRAMRTHVSDMWRLHRRILRNRRTDETACYLPGRGGLHKVLYHCEAESGLANAVASWRLSLSNAFFGAEAATRERVTELVREMEQCAACEPRAVVALAKKRERQCGDETTIDRLPLVNGERDLLQRITRMAQQNDQEAKLLALFQLIGQGSSNESFVVFADQTETADRIQDFLELRLPVGRVLRHSTEDLGWTQFRSNKTSHVLVCDKVAEEGLNLQKRGATVIHYDLPFSPNRIEQRMGRLDRFGIGMPVRSVAVLCQDSDVQQQWCRLLEESLGVFDHSIATLQYVIDEEMQTIWAEFLDAGSEAFEEAASRLGGDEGSVERELRRIRAQDEIDSFEDDALTTEAFEELLGADMKLACRSSKVFDAWLVSRLHFQKHGEEGRSDDVFSYRFTRRDDFGRGPGRNVNDTLLPVSEFLWQFSESMDDVASRPPIVGQTVPLTFDRVTSQRRATRLVRFGDPFVDSLERLTRWDERGICFAFWRWLREYDAADEADVFFRFDFIVEPDRTPFVELCNQYPGANIGSLVRRTDAIMTPMFTTIWLDSNLDRVIDASLLTLLKAPFRKHDSQNGTDFNLNPDRWKQAAACIDLSLWADLCFSAREKAEFVLREQSRLPEWMGQCEQVARHRASHLFQQYLSRISMANESQSVSLQDDLKFERAFINAQSLAFRQPVLKVDSLGAIFMSPIMPFVKPPEEYDY